MITSRAPRTPRSRRAKSTLRLLKAAIAGRPAPYMDAELTALAAHCTQQEDNAKKVERQVRNDVFQSLTFTRRVLTLVSTASLRRGDRIFLFAVAKVGAGIDLSQLKDEDIVVDQAKKSVRIRLQKSA